MKSPSFRPFLFSLYLLLFFHGGLFNRLSAQPRENDNDSLLLRAAYAGAIAFYHQYLKPETGLYRGIQYADYAYLIKEGHPFFNEDRFRMGSLFYNGVFYDKVNLLYDLVTEQVVTNDPYNIYKIALINPSLDRFSIGEHLFLHLRDSLDPSAPRPGFYELLLQQESPELPVFRLLKKEKKTVQDDLSPPEGIRRYIIHSVSYYLQSGKEYRTVNTRQSLLHAMKDRAKEAKKFMRKNGLVFKQDKENTIKRVAAWYAGLNQ